MWFLKAILIFLIIVWLLGFFARWWFRRFLKKVQKNMQGYTDDLNSQAKREGDVTINVNPNNSSPRASEGEYVDFEEIK